MTELIQLSKAIHELATDAKHYKKLHDNYMYYARENGLTLTNSKTKYYEVDAEQFYDWVKLKFPNLKADILEKYRLTTYQGVFNAQSELKKDAPAPKFSSSDEAKQIIQGQANEIRDLKKYAKKMIEDHKRVFAEVKKKADKWDNFIEKKRGKRPRHND